MDPTLNPNTNLWFRYQNCSLHLQQISSEISPRGRIELAEPVASSAHRGFANPSRFRTRFPFPPRQDTQSEHPTGSRQFYGAMGSTAAIIALERLQSEPRSQAGKELHGNLHFGDCARSAALTHPRIPEIKIFAPRCLIQRNSHPARAENLARNVAFHTTGRAETGERNNCWGARLVKHRASGRAASHRRAARLGLCGAMITEYPLEDPRYDQSEYEPF